MRPPTPQNEGTPVDAFSGVGLAERLERIANHLEQPLEGLLTCADNQETLRARLEETMATAVAALVAAVAGEENEEEGEEEEEQAEAAASPRSSPKGGEKEQPEKQPEQPQQPQHQPFVPPSTEQLLALYEAFERLERCVDELSAWTEDLMLHRPDLAENVRFSAVFAPLARNLKAAADGVGACVAEIHAMLDRLVNAYADFGGLGAVPMAMNAEYAILWRRITMLHDRSVRLIQTSRRQQAERIRAAVLPVLREMGKKNDRGRGHQSFFH